ncbi:hypothetical protein FKP32DRAFT_66633 [Trametes sanguinea]|nr:hypothetical protein FKP32DRAFT_66633 [Trametes sanguinea]
MPWTSFHTVFPHSFHPIPHVPGASASQAPTSRSFRNQVCPSILLGTPDTSTLSSVPSYNLIPRSSCHSKLDVSAVFLSSGGSRSTTLGIPFPFPSGDLANRSQGLGHPSVHSALLLHLSYPIPPTISLVLPPHKNRPTPRNTLRTTRPRIRIVASATDGARPWPFCHIRAIPWTWTR